MALEISTHDTSLAFFTSTIKNPRLTRTAATLIVCLSLVGCAANGQTGMGQKQEIGTGVGALLGGIGGAFVGHGAGKVVAVVAGAAIGGFIGNRVGAMLDEQDREAVQAQAKQALLTKPDNTSVHWTSPQTGATATIEPVNSRMEKRSVKIVRNAEVAPSPQMDLIGRQYVTKSATHVRLAPSTKAEIATTLSGHAPIWAVGKVQGQPWIMVARGGKSIGYVTATNVEPAPVSHTASAAQTNAPATNQPANSASNPAPFDMDASAPVQTPADLDSLGPNEKTDVVEATVPCRDIKTTVTAKGQTQTSTATACQSPDGAWNLD